MTATGLTVTIFVAFFCLLCVVSHLHILRTLFRLRRFEDLAPPEPVSRHRLSVIVAARDEALTLPEAVRTLLAQDYPDLEVILVDDRSTDGTGDLLDALARDDPRIRAVHVRELPPGWLGKVHALHAGTHAATGDWLLYTDADVHFAPGTLRKAVAEAEARGMDHLVLMPGFREASFSLNVVLSAFLNGFLLLVRPSAIGRPRSRAFAGAGAFNLVRRAALERTEGFEWLRMEVVDDVGLGLMLHRAGARGGFAAAFHEVNVRWYPSVGALVRGLEKNLFAGARYSLTRLFAGLLGIAALLPAPVAALVIRGVPGLWSAGAAAALSLIAVALVLKIRYRLPLLPALLSPAGTAVLAAAMLRSGILCSLRGGIVWRGTFYPLRDLRRGQRLTL